MILYAKIAAEQPNIEPLPSSENEEPPPDSKKAFEAGIHLPLAEAKSRLGQGNSPIPIEF
jgi:hypothetical protein